MERKIHGLVGRLLPHQFTRIMVDMIDLVSQPAIADVGAVVSELGTLESVDKLSRLKRATGEYGVHTTSLDKLRIAGVMEAHQLPLPLVLLNQRYYFDLARIHPIEPQAYDTALVNLNTLSGYAAAFEHHLTDSQFAQVLSSTLTETFKQQIATIHGYSELILSGIGYKASGNGSRPRFSSSIIEDNFGYHYDAINNSADLIEMFVNAVKYLEQVQAHKMQIPLVGYQDHVTLDLRATLQKPTFKMLFPPAVHLS